MKKLISCFTKFELFLWCCSCIVIITLFAIFDGSYWLSLGASLIGVTSLIFCAKGNPIGLGLMIVFSALYGIISFSFSYYGEMITYLGMTAPISAMSLISWLRNPHAGNKSEVEVNRISKNDVTIMMILTVIVTIAFYFILSALNTVNLLPSTFSVATSFTAGFLMLKRSPYFSFAYAANDLVLVVLWTLAAMTDISYISTLACFAVFLINDIYSFVNWRKIQKRQNT